MQFLFFPNSRMPSAKEITHIFAYNMEQQNSLEET
jgi:hypothetical protein